MSRSARSMYVFGILLILVGATFIVSPNTVLVLMPAAADE
jgi:hypothetical protein